MGMWEGENGDREKKKKEKKERKEKIEFYRESIGLLY